MRSDSNFTPASARGEKCRMCGQPAQRKVEEVIFSDDPMEMRHPYTAYVCLEHFNEIMEIGDTTNIARYIRFGKGKAKRTVELVQDTIMADYDDQGNLLGIEIVAPRGEKLAI
jgi:uncharacterized protein YuzE